MKNMIKRFKNERGITLVELLAVVVILAIIGTIAFVLIGNVIENSKKDAHVANAQQMISSAKLYEANGGELGSISAEQLKSEGFLEELINPWDADENYEGSVTKTDGGEYQVTITGEGIKDCNITNTPESKILKGREEVCKD